MDDPGQPSSAAPSRSRWRALLASIFDGNFPLGAIQAIGEQIDQSREPAHAEKMAKKPDALKRS